MTKHCGDCNLDWPDTKAEVQPGNKVVQVDRRTCPACGNALVKLNRPEVQAEPQISKPGPYFESTEPAPIPAELFQAEPMEIMTMPLEVEPRPLPETFAPGEATFTDDVAALIRQTSKAYDERDEAIARALYAEKEVMGCRVLIHRLEDSVRMFETERDKKVRASNEAIVADLAACIIERDQLNAERAALTLTLNAVSNARDLLVLQVRDLQSQIAADKRVGCYHSFRFEMHSDEPATNLKRVMKRVQRCTKCGLIIGAEPKDPGQVETPAEVTATEVTPEAQTA